MAATPLKPAEDGSAAEPMRFGHEQHGFTFEERDPLLTIQGKVPKLISDTHKKPAQQVLHFNQMSIQTASLQARYFLNAYWDKVSINGAAQAERIYQEWKIWCDLGRTENQGDDPTAFDQKLSQTYLDKLKRGMTNEQFKNEFRAIDSNNDGRMAFLEYLLWDANKVWNPNGKTIIITPAHMTYRPQVFGKDGTNTKLGKAIAKVLKAQRARRADEDDKTALEEAINKLKAEGAGAAKLGKAENNLAQFMKKRDVSRLDGDIASANASLLKTFHTCSEKGSEWWAARLKQQKEQDGPKGRKGKINMRGFE